MSSQESLENELLVIKQHIADLRHELLELKKPRDQPPQPPPEITMTQVDAVKAYFSSKGQAAAMVKFVNAHCVVGRLSPKVSFKITRAFITIQENRETALEQLQTPSELKALLFGC